MTKDKACDVLIVEDDMFQCEMMADHLWQAGLSIQMAHGCEFALRAAAIHRPRVALIDYNLPGTTGVQVAAHLRALSPHMPIILMSASIDGLSEEILEEVGITLFVSKPVPIAALRQALIKLARVPAGRPSPSRQKSWLAAGIGSTRH